MTQETTERLETEFVSLVKKSWQIHEVYFWNNSIDEVLIGAVINASLEKGYLLIDIKSEHPFSYATEGQLTVGSESDATGCVAPINSHFLRFENPQDSSRLLYELNRITTSLSEAKTLGQLARITLGYGEKAKDFGKVFQVLKQEFKSSFVDTTEPGIIMFDADELSGYIYAKVTVIVNIAEYNKDNQTGNIDYDKLNCHIESIIHSLKKYLKGRDLV